MVGRAMETSLFSYETVGYGNIHVSLEGNGGMNKGEQLTQLIGSEDWGDMDFIYSQDGGFQDMSTPEKGAFLLSEQDSPVFDFETLDFQYNILSPPFQTPMESADLTQLSDSIQLKNQKPYQTNTLTSLELLNGYKSGYNKMNEGYVKPCKVVDYKRLSTEEVMRVAGAQFIQFSDRKEETMFSMFSHPFGSTFAGLSDEETRDVELARLLLASAEKIGSKLYDRGSKLLAQCAYLSSSAGSPVQRIAHYFSEALLERINRETGRISSMGTKQRGPMDIESEFMMSPTAAAIACHQLLPFSQVLQFPGVQAIVESIALAKKVHLVDLSIKTGLTWTVLMQALAGRHELPIEMLRITAVGTQSEQELNDTGRRLTCFAQTMNIPFSYKVIMVKNMEDLKEELFEVAEDEAIAVYCSFVLRTMLTRSDRLDSLIRAIRNLNPCVMVIAEVEGNHNSPSFFNRFIESLFYYSAFFDSFDDCMGRDNPNRNVMEGVYFREAIVNIVATEGEQRTYRQVGIDVWRAFFERFGMVEIEFSHSSMYQANLIGKQFSCGSSCTLEMNRKCLIVGWKGTPLHSLSAWKFH